VAYVEVARSDSERGELVLRERRPDPEDSGGPTVLELRAKLKTMQDREATLLDQRDRYRGRYLQFPRAAIQMSRLEREVKVNADLLATLKAKLQELQIKSAEQIEEVTIVGNHEYNLIIVGQEVFQPGYRFEIQVVGRFIE